MFDAQQSFWFYGGNGIEANEIDSLSKKHEKNTTNHVDQETVLVE